MADPDFGIFYLIAAFPCRILMQFAGQQADAGGRDRDGRPARHGHHG